MNPYWRRLYTRWLIRLYLWRNLGRKHPDPPITQEIRLKTLEMLHNTYKCNRSSVLGGFLVPAELFHLYGLSPMSTEFLAPMLSATGKETSSLEATESQGFSRDTCSFHRATLGAFLLGYLPSFNLIVSTSHLCDGQNKTLEELALRSDSPYILLDVPQENTPEAVKYLAAQIKELEDRCVSLTGRKAGYKEWQNVFNLSNQTRELMLQVNELRSRSPCCLYGREAFNLSLLSLLMMGTRFLRDSYQNVVNRLKNCSHQEQEKEKYFRILWLLAFPYFKGNFIPQMEEEFGLRAVADELSHIYWSPLDPENPHRSLAYRMLQNPNLGPVVNRVKLVEHLCKKYQAEGVVHFSHWGCRQGCAGVRPISDSLKNLGVPFLELHGDCIDSRQESQGQSRTRLQGFVEMLSRKKKRTLTSSTLENSGYYLGLDIGSLTAKTVLINSKGEIIHSKILHTGSSSKRTTSLLHQELLEKRSEYAKIRASIATGYGRKSVDFADDQVTEISCHARGMAHLIPGIKTIIDIGGQDTKVISIDPAGAVRKFVMNDKCAAGTGRFLEMMARTLEVDIEDLGPLALKSGNHVDISSMCTVFAESEVISLIADDTPIEIIAKGVCRSIAHRTIAMLDRVGREKKIAMSGGVAKNIAVVKELEEILGLRLKIPEEPQIIGALGAALFARDLQG